LLFDGKVPEQHHWRILNPVAIEGAVQTDGIIVIVLRFSKNHRKRKAQIKNFIEEYNSMALQENKVKLHNGPDGEGSIFASSEDAPYTDNNFYRFVQAQDSRFVWDFASDD
jgi:hypothetical protein